MKSAQLASIITAAITVSPLDSGQSVYIHPVTGKTSTVVGAVPLPGSSIRLDRLQNIPEFLVEAWINHVFLDEVRNGDAGCFRDHTGSGGYGVNIHPNARVMVTRSLTGGLVLSAVLVRK